MDPLPLTIPPAAIPSTHNQSPVQPSISATTLPQPPPSPIPISAPLPPPPANPPSRPRQPFVLASPVPISSLLAATRYPIQNRVLKGKRWNPSVIFNQEKFISYFIDHIPEKCSPKRLFEVISKNERVIDVFIPDKRSFRGSRFGFPKFLKCQKLEAEEERLDVLNSIRVDNARLHFNVAKYRVQSGSYMNRIKKRPAVTDGTAVVRRESSLYCPDNGRSFASVLKENLRSGAQHGNLIEVQAENVGHNLSWLCRSAIGTVIEDFKFLKTIPTEIEVKLFGGDMVILTFPSALVMHDMLCMRVEPWLKHFSDIHPWRSDDKATRRVCWVTLSNIPVQSWQEINFRHIVKPFGRLVQVDRRTLSMERVDAAKVCIVTDSVDFIKEEIFFCLGGVKHKVLVQEFPSWDLPFESVSEDFKMSTEGAALAQSPMSCASIPKAQPKELGIGPSERTSDILITKAKEVGHQSKSPSTDKQLARETKHHLGREFDPNLSDFSEGSPVKKPTKVLSPPKSKHTQQVSVQTSLDLPVISLYQKKKKVNSSSQRKHVESLPESVSCTRRISFESPKKATAASLGKFIPLSKKLLEKSNTKKKKIKRISENGSIRSSGASEVDEKNTATEEGAPCQKEFTDPLSFPPSMVPPVPGAPCPSRVPKSSEACKTLAMINQMGLESDDSIANLVKHLEKKVEAEFSEYIRSHAN